MASSEQPLSKSTLKNRSELVTLEKELLNLEIDSRTTSRLIALGSNSNSTSAFAKLFGYVDTDNKTVQVKESIALPCLEEGQAKALTEMEMQEKRIRKYLGFSYSNVGLFVVSENEDIYGEEVMFFLSHYNVFEGFCVLVVYSKETAKIPGLNPLKAYKLSQHISDLYEYKEEKELFEPNPRLLETLTKNKLPLLTPLTLKVALSPVLELIISKNESSLKANNPLPKPKNSRETMISNLENGLVQQSNDLFKVLNSKKSLEMKRQHLLNFNGALLRNDKLVQLKKLKLKGDERKLNNLKGWAN